jgi:hypothetical protein
VQVRLDTAGAFLAGAPLELTLAGGKPLAKQLATFVYHTTGASPGAKQPVGDQLRILALLGAPAPGSLMQLRRERYELVRSIRTAGAGKRVDLRVLQYGVTADTLGDALDMAPGWDVLHLCSGGGFAGLCLEHDDGAPAELTTDKLIDLLQPTADRLKLVVLSANRSGADSVAALRALDLPDEAEKLERDLLGAATPAGSSAVMQLAQRLVDELDVAVLAMRYPVADQFAIAFARALYTTLLRSGQPVDRALAMSRRRVPDGAPAILYPPQSIATPVLYGPQAVNLLVAPPAGTPANLYGRRTLPALNDKEPPRLIGQVAKLARASAALSSASGHAGVLFVGDPRIGKTTCALELTYQRWDDFDDRAWWRAPATVSGDLRAVRDTLFTAWQAQLGFQLQEDVGTVDGLAAFATRFRAWLAEASVLLVLDNIDVLLTPQGDWRDPAWATLTAALTGHGGRSRVILTSRITPEPGLPNVLVSDVGPLTGPESVLLSCELPSLGGLLHHLHADCAACCVADPAAGASDRTVLQGVLKAASGSPYLLEVADDVIGFARDLPDRDAADARRTVVASVARCATDPDDTAGPLLRVLLADLTGGPLWTAAAPALAALLDGTPMPDEFSAPVGDLIDQVRAEMGQASLGANRQ